MKEKLQFREMMDIREFVMMEGSIIERLARDGLEGIRGPAANAGLLLTEVGREALASAYLEYIDIARRHKVPVLLLTPTWRANPDRLREAGLPDVDTISMMAVDFLREMAAESGHEDMVYIGGLMGCYGDAYKPEEALSEEAAYEFHRQQSTALAGAGADYLMAATLPQADEAVGISRAMTETGVPAIPSYVIRADGGLLDGTPLHTVVKRVDEECSPRPIFHMVNCVHPVVYRQAMEREIQADAALTKRILGLQANTSPRSPEELDGLDHLEGDGPEPFAAAMAGARSATGLKLLGGCCGTDTGHLKEMIHRVLL
jgi:homocysteine S-methyltransferase